MSRQTKHQMTAPHASLAILVLATGALFVTATASAGDWPQYRGPNRDGVSSETDLAKQWPATGPSMLWSAQGIGAGYSSPAVADGMLYVTGVKNKKEFLSAYTLAGERKWQTEYGVAWVKSFPPARTTPTILADAAFVISGAGEMVRLETATGQITWSRNAKELFGGRTGPWGTAESPLIVDGKVIYTPAGNKTTMVALDQKSGETVWQSPPLNDKSAYASPILIDHNGRKMIVGLTGDYVFAVSPKDGALLWKFKYGAHSAPKRGGSINCTSPIYHDGRLFITSGYNHGGVMLELTKDGAPTPVWTSPDLDTHHGGGVLLDSHLYGSNWISNRQGNWVCVDWETGKTLYEKPWQTKGSVVAADGMLYCYDEKQGNLALVKASPQDFEVVSSFKITLGAQQHWSHPAISNGRLYLRHGDALMAFDIKGAR